MIICLINGRSVPFELVILDDFCFGKPMPASEKAKYDLIILMNEFREVTEIEFNNFVKDMKEDDEKFNDMYSVELYEAGYPNYVQAMENHKAIVEQYIRDFYSEFIYRCLKNCNNDRKTYDINTLDSITILDDRVIIKGDAYIPKPRKY